MQIAQKHVAIYDKDGNNTTILFRLSSNLFAAVTPKCSGVIWSRMVEEVKMSKSLLPGVWSSHPKISAMPTPALVLATAAFQAVNVNGYPEAWIIPSQCATQFGSAQ